MRQATLQGNLEHGLRRGGQKPSESDLVELATPVFELILSLKSGTVAPSIDLRRAVGDLLAQMQQQAGALGYPERQVQAVKFALAALVDETVLTEDFSIRDQWEKYPLQLEYFGEQFAGVKFFERLDELLRNLDDDAEVVEVYYICMLLGYKGKYKRYLEDQLKGVIEDVAVHLRRAGRLASGTLAPHWKVTDQPEVRPDPGLPKWVKIGGGAALGLVLLLYVIFYFLLNRDSNEALDKLLR